MRFLDRYPILVTQQKNSCRDFWVQYLAFEVVFDSTWFVLLSAPDASASIAFMTPDHPSAPPGPEEYSGKGMCFELQVEHVDTLHEQCAAAGLPIAYPLRSEPFGQRRFGFRDPSGLWVDVVEQIEPASGYWDPYLVQP
jgi:catechol 2,3-dioxygenase-like lactoylglutathione lyase family enzyme